MSLQHFDAVLGGQQDVSVLVVAYALGGEVQQDAFGAFVVVSAKSVRSGLQQLLAQVSPETFCTSSTQQSSVGSALQVDAGSVLLELLLLLPYALVSASSGVGDLQHELVSFGFAGPIDEQHELVGFGFSGSGSEQHESADFCFIGADEEQEESDAFGF